MRRGVSVLLEKGIGSEGAGCEREDVLSVAGEK